MRQSKGKTGQVVYNFTCSTKLVLMLSHFIKIKGLVEKVRVSVFNLK